MYLNRKVIGLKARSGRRVSHRRFETRQAGPRHSDLNMLLTSISADSKALGLRVREAVDMLVEQAEWTAAIRLVVGVGGHQQADVAHRLGVMRSTVARWYNGETRPSDDQLLVYAAGLRELLSEAPVFELNPEDSLVS